MRVRPRTRLPGSFPTGRRSLRGRLLLGTALAAVVAGIVTAVAPAAPPASATALDPAAVLDPAATVLDPAAAMTLMDTRAAAGLPADVADFGIDEATGKVAVSLVGDAPAAARPALAPLLAGIGRGVLDVRTGAPAPRHQAAVRGGDTIVNGELRCTVGFVATGGDRDWLLTAGHCTRGSATWYVDAEPIGRGARTAAAGTDVGAIPVTEPGWQPKGAVGTVAVKGAAPAAAGAAVCLYGSTSGKVCGTITGRDRTVNFEGTVQRGMTATSICSREGDSGGGYVTAAGQAQGIHSGGGTGSTCISYFTPVSTALSAFGLRLRTG